jgi:nicotinamidase-related amidase
MITALVLIDLQNDYFEYGANPLVNAHIAIQNAELVLNTFRQKGLPVVHIQHIATKPTATFFLPNTPGCDIHPAVTPLATETVIIKHYPNSFRDTHLLAHFNSLGVTHLVICGMMTHMCVDATVRAACDLGFSITLAADACATKDLAFNGITVPALQVHHSFLAALNQTYATLETTAGIISTL